jgi:hypothetical protein
MSTLVINRDLTKRVPYSPRERIKGFVIACRAGDKCRAGIAGTLGEYHYDFPLDSMLLSFKRITREQFKYSGEAANSYEDAGAWLPANETHRTIKEIRAWSVKMESDSPIKNPQKRAGFIKNCSFLGLNSETNTTFDWKRTTAKVSAGSPLQFEVVPYSQTVYFL